MEIETDKASYTKLVEFEEKGGVLTQAEPIVFVAPEACAIENYWLHIWGGRVRMSVPGGRTTLLAGCTLNVQGMNVTVT